MDILPTLAAITGAPLPKNKIDGLNFLPLLLNEEKQGPRDTFYYYFGMGTANLEAIRYKNWKLVLPHMSMTYAALQGKDGFPGKIGRVNVPMELFNIALDPGEDHDVKELYPEIVDKLLNIANKAREDLGDGITKIEGKNVRAPAILN